MLKNVEAEADQVQQVSDGPFHDSLMRAEQRNKWRRDPVNNSGGNHDS